MLSIILLVYPCKIKLEFLAILEFSEWSTEQEIYVQCLITVP